MVEILRLSLSSGVIKLIKAYAALQGETVSEIAEKIFMEKIEQEKRINTSELIENTKN
ncbi:MAG: hypothetical protein WCD18_21055 [Thermosynechococcaceae cyanobacterium]